MKHAPIQPRRKILLATLMYLLLAAIPSVAGDQIVDHRTPATDFRGTADPPGSAATTTPQLSRYPHSMEMRAVTGETVFFDYEVVSEPEAALLYRVIRIEVGPDGRQYYLDEGDGDIKVFGSDNEYLFRFGGVGQAPGEWQSATVFSVAPSGRVYVWDATNRLLHAFNGDGEFLHRIYYQDGRFQPEGFVWLDDNEVIVGGLSLNVGYFGYFLHRMRVEVEEDGLRVLKRVVSFAETGSIAPGLYLDVAGGLVGRDIDGGLLFSSRVAHRVEKYAADGDLIWTVSDPNILAPASDYFEATETGRVRFTRFSQPASLLSTDEWIVHVVFREPPDPPTEAEIAAGTPDLSRVVFPKYVELIDRRDPNERLVIETNADFWLRTNDNEGRAYGVVNMFDDPTPIRGVFRLQK